MNFYGKQFYFNLGDSAYAGQQTTLEKYEVVDQICEKGYKNNPLTAEQKAANKSKIKEFV